MKRKNKRSQISARLSPHLLYILLIAIIAVLALTATVFSHSLVPGSAGSNNSPTSTPLQISASACSAGGIGISIENPANTTLDVYAIDFNVPLGMSVINSSQTMLSPEEIASGQTKWVNLSGVKCNVTGSRYSASITLRYTVLHSGQSKNQTFDISGTAVSVPLKYINTTFKEIGLPSNRTWTVNYNGINASSESPYNITFNFTAPFAGGYYRINGLMNSSRFCNTNYYISSQSEGYLKSGLTDLIVFNHSTTCNYALPVNWERIGPMNISFSLADSNGVFRTLGAGKANAFAQNYTNYSIMYVGGGSLQGPYSASGIYKSIDRGLTWFPADNGLNNTAVNALLIERGGGNVILAGTSFGLYRSSDGAADWQLVWPGVMVTAMVQVNSSIYASAGNYLLYSVNSGENWTAIHSFNMTILHMASSQNMLYLGLSNGGVVAHRIGSDYWNYSLIVNNSQIASLSADQVDPHTIYAAEWSGYGNTSIMYKSVNGGDNWSVMDINKLDGNFSETGIGSLQVVAVDPFNSSILYGGGDIPLLESTNGGKSFFVNKFEGDVRMIYFYSPNEIVVGSDQGLYESTDGGINWSSLNGNRTSSMTYSVAVAGNTIFASMQDYSPVASFDGGGHWESLWNSSAPGGEGGTMVFDPYNSSCILFAGGMFGAYQYSTDGGHVFRYGNMHLVGPLSFNHSDPEEIFSVNYTSNQYQPVYSTDCGINWVPLVWPIMDPLGVFVNPSNPNDIFAYNSSGIYHTQNAWKTWSKSGGPSGTFSQETKIELDPSNSSVILVTPVIYGINAPKGYYVLRSTNGGDNFSVVNDNMSLLLSVAFMPNSSLVVAVGEGIYVSADEGLSWYSISGNSILKDFSFAKFNYALFNGPYLYVSTLGEGIIRAPLSEIKVPR